MTDTVHVIAVLETKPGMRGLLLAAFADNLAAVHAEKGCIKYIPTIDHDATLAEYGPDTVVVVEEWATIEDLKAHGVAPHMVSFGEKIAPLMAGRTIHFVQEASS